MKTFGVRCSNSDFAYAIIEGDKDKPKIINSSNVNFPKNFSDGERLYWFSQEINTLLQQHKPDNVVIKAAEPMVKRSNNLDTRLHNESIIFMTAESNGIKNAIKKTKATIAKDLGLKGKGKYLETKLDTSPIDNFDSFNIKIQEAILAGWSSMN